MIGISNYEGLCNREMNLPEYIRARAQEGYKFIRVFTDLAWWIAPASMNPSKSLFLYEYDTANKRFKPGVINQEFVKKLHECGKVAKQGGMEGITLCLATNPKYYSRSVPKSYPWQLGYRDSAGGYINRPDTGFIHVVDIGTSAWKAFERYVADLAKVCADAPNPFMFRIFETFNELKRWGSTMDSHPAIQKAARSRKPNIQFQMNPPLEELRKSFDEVLKITKSESKAFAAAFEWPKRLSSATGTKGFKAQRLAFHGFYTGNEISRIAGFLKRGGLDLNRVVFETDGATPNTIFTMEEHTRHYDWRIKWRDSEENVRKTIRAHRDLIAAAKTAGVHLNIQDPIKWSLMEEDSKLDRFHRECANEVAR